MSYPSKLSGAAFTWQMAAPTIISLFKGSRRTEAIEAPGIICPLRIGEIKRIVGQGDGLERSPYRLGEIGAGVHFDGLAAWPVDVEAELIGLHPKVKSIGLDFQVQQHRRHCRAVRKCIAPAGGIGQIIYRCVVSRVEQIRTDGRRVSREIDTIDIVFFKIECILPNVGYTTRNREALKAGTPGKSELPDAGNGVGNEYVGKIVVVLKLVISDIGNASRKRKAGQFGTNSEDFVTDTSDTAGNRDAG